MTDCVFCQIAKDTSKGNVVYEDDVCYALLDARPAVSGHVLIVPKEHVVILPQASDELVGHLGIVAKKVSRAIIVQLKVHGTTTLVPSGLAGGQGSQHFMMHVIPRNVDDGLSFEADGQGADSAEIRETIQSKVKELLG